MCADSLLVSTPLAMGPSMNSLSVISGNLTLNHTTSLSMARLLLGFGSTPCLRHSDAAHRSRAVNNRPSCLSSRLSRLAISATSSLASSSKRSCRRTVAGSESISLMQASRREAQTTAVTSRSEIITQSKIPAERDQPDMNLELV